MPREDGIASLEGDGHADSDKQCIGEFRIDRMLFVDNKAHSLIRFEASSGEDLENMKLGNCSGHFVIRICRNRHEFNRFRAFNQSNHYHADMSERAVPACQNESSEAT